MLYKTLWLVLFFCLIYPPLFLQIHIHDFLFHLSLTCLALWVRAAILHLRVMIEQVLNLSAFKSSTLKWRWYNSTYSWDGGENHAMHTNYLVSCLVLSRCTINGNYCYYVTWNRLCVQGQVTEKRLCQKDVGQCSFCLINVGKKLHYK